MAETPRPNDLTIDELAKVYTGLADELVERESYTRTLGDRARILGFEDNFRSNHEVKISVLDVSQSGLLDYEGQYPQTKLKVTTKTYTMGKDRALRIMYDKLTERDNNVKGMSLSYAMNKIIRQKVVPEIDAYHFANIYSKISSPQDFSSATNMLDTIDGIIDNIFNSTGLNNEDFVLFVNSDVRKKIKQEIEAKQVRFEGTDINVNGYTFKVPSYEDIPIITIPKSRFYTKIKLYTETDYSSNQSQVGYAKDPSEGKDIAFLLLPRAAYLPLQKFEEMKIAPDSVTNTKDRNNSAALNIIYDGIYEDIMYKNLVFGMKMADEAVLKTGGEETEKGKK
jgi:hypothetical protein